MPAHQLSPCFLLLPIWPPPPPPAGAGCRSRPSSSLTLTSPFPLPCSSPPPSGRSGDPQRTSFLTSFQHHLPHLPFSSANTLTFCHQVSHLLLGLKHPHPPNPWDNSKDTNATISSPFLKGPNQAIASSVLSLCSLHPPPQGLLLGTSPHWHPNSRCSLCLSRPLSTPRANESFVKSHSGQIT